MKPVEITYYGHSCFRIACDEQSVILDPYADDSVPGLKLPQGLTAGKVYCSHGHSDHNARNLVEETAVLEDPFDVKFITVPHDDCDGAKRGLSDITVLDIDGTKAVHFGDIGRPLTSEEYGYLKDADIVMIPVGGFYTIDAKKAAAIVRRLHPKLTVLMHYRTDDFGYDVTDHIKDVLPLFKDVKQLDESTYTFTGDEAGSIITLKPLQ